jgi:hypothetical protein
MHPGKIAGELLDEKCRGDRPARSSTGVADVGDLALERFL